MYCFCALFESGIIEFSMFIYSVALCMQQPIGHLSFLLQQKKLVLEPDALRHFMERQLDIP
jgi:hypothetical protein